MADRNPTTIAILMIESVNILTSVHIDRPLRKNKTDLIPTKDMYGWASSRHLCRREIILQGFFNGLPAKPSVLTLSMFKKDPY